MQDSGSVLAGALLMVANSTHAIAVKDAKFSAPEIKKRLVAIYGNGRSI